jgi:hypothetical protein
MTDDPIYEGAQHLGEPSGKLAGVVDSDAKFQEVVASLKKAGFDQIKSLHGPDGVRLLEHLHGFFFSDYEDEALQNHIAELHAGHYILIVGTDFEGAKKAAAIAEAHGARYLVYFGLLVNARLTR